MPIQRTTALQLGDMQDEAVQQLVANAAWPDRASEAYGWFTYGGNQHLHTAVSARFSATMKTAPKPGTAPAGSVQWVAWYSWLHVWLQ